MPMKPTPMPKKTGKPKKAMGMAMGGMTDKPMAKPGYGTTAPMPGKGKRPMAMGMAKGGMTKKGKK